MDRIKKNFGFGCMRLPMIGEEVDIEQTKQMVDAFLDAGFNYFDTAHGYIQGKSEKALKTCLTSRYPRDRYVLTDKLTGSYFKTEADIRPFFESQLEICGVEYFDFYLMHAQGLVNYDHFKECRAYETAFALKKEGKIRHVGISFHDRAEVLERILTEYPEIEVVQIQFNYVDYDDPAVQSRKCYEVCRKFNKPVIVMEPVKGGNLVNLPEDAKAVLEDLHGVELEGVVEDGIEDENAPGLHVGDGLERLNGEASGHAADELVASDGPDGIARGFRLLDGQRELEAPFEHHLEDDIHIGAIGLDHVEEELTGLGLLNAGLIELEHTEADVGKLLGSLAKLELTVGFLELGFDFVACAANASFAYVAESLIPVLVGVAFRVTRLWKLDKDKLIAIIFSELLQEHGMGGRC